MLRYIVGLVIVLLGTLADLAAADAQTGKRVALVVGNARYEHIAALPNVPNDAKAMAALLQAAGFDSVVLLHDQRAADLKRALRKLADRAAGADVAVLFYAGHGIEVERVNYLIPVDARLKSDLDVEDETVSLDRVLQLMEPARRLRVVLLDACRDNPFAKSMKLTAPTRSVGRGLGRIEAGGANTLIAFATEPYGVAEDGAGSNSPFTAALVKHLATPGLDLRLALGSVRDEVMASTKAKQKPYVTSSLGGGVFSLAPKGSDPAGLTPGQPVSPPAPPAPADLAWAAVKDSGDIPALETFRQHYGKERPVYDRLAALRIEGLKAQRLALLKAEEEHKRDPALAVKPASGASFRDRTADGRPCPECPEMLVVPAGSFTMGSPVREEGRQTNEGPQRRVRIARPFVVGKFEATFAEWDACLAEGGCSHRPDDNGWGRGKRPVMRVSWDDITQQYLPWLSRKTGKTYRLLTEAEWEYVARAGTSTTFWWGTSISTGQANYNGDYTYGGGPKGEYRAKTLAVDSFAPNPWGLYNVHGNVWEWVQDCWNNNYNGAPSDGSALTTGACSRRVLRGGSWVINPFLLRAAYRGRGTTVDRYVYLGFRVGRILSP